MIVGDYGGRFAKVLRLQCLEAAKEQKQTWSLQVNWPLRLTKWATDPRNHETSALPKAAWMTVHRVLVLIHFSALAANERQEQCVLPNPH